MEIYSELVPDDALSLFIAFFVVGLWRLTTATCAEYIRTGGRSRQLPFRSLTQEIPNGGIVVKLLVLSQPKKGFQVH